MEPGKRWTWTVAALAVGMAWTSATVAEAQLNARARPRFGVTNLRRGFTPDPRVLRGQMGGPIRANQVNGSCRGHIAPRPSHIIRSNTGFRQLRFVVSAASDATMLVMLPNGQVLCDDDGGEGLNPLIATSSPPGPIRVWVGSYSSGSTGNPYTLGVTELSHVSADDLGQPGGQPAAASGVNPRGRRRPSGGRTCAAGSRRTRTCSASRPAGRSAPTRSTGAAGATSGRRRAT